MKKSATKLKYKEITSTELKQNTRKVINMVREQGVPYLVKTFDEPKVVIVDFDEWNKLLNVALPNEIKSQTNEIGSKKIKHKNISRQLKKLRQFQGSYPKMPNAVKFFRRMRDGEGI